MIHTQSGVKIPAIDGTVYVRTHSPLFAFRKKQANDSDQFVVLDDLVGLVEFGDQV